MKTRFIMIVGVIGLALVIAAATALGGSSAVDRKRSYFRDCIQSEIDSCNPKMKLATSRSEHLRTYGDRAVQKEAFLRKNSETLVEEMVIRNVTMRPHAVHQYLLHRFNEESR
jgi:hypothetical protein